MKRQTQPKRRSTKEPAPLKFPPSAELAPLFARAVLLALELPGVAESRSYGTPSLKVKDKFLARLRSEAEGGLAIVCDLFEREMLLQAGPETFYITDHYANAAMILIDLTTVRWDAMPGILERAWRMVAPPGLIAERDRDNAGPQ